MFKELETSVKLLIHSLTENDRYRNFTVCRALPDVKNHIHEKAVVPAHWASTSQYNIKTEFSPDSTQLFSTVFLLPATVAAREQTLERRGQS